MIQSSFRIRLCIFRHSCYVHNTFSTNKHSNYTHWLLWLLNSQTMAAISRTNVKKRSRMSCFWTGFETSNGIECVDVLSPQHHTTHIHIRPATTWNILRHVCVVQSKAYAVSYTFFYGQPDLPWLAVLFGGSSRCDVTAALTHRHTYIKHWLYQFHMRCVRFLLYAFFTLTNHMQCVRVCNCKPSYWHFAVDIPTDCCFLYCSMYFCRIVDANVLFYINGLYAEEIICVYVR